MGYGRFSLGLYRIFQAPRTTVSFLFDAQDLNHGKHAPLHQNAKSSACSLSAYKRMRLLEHGDRPVALKGEGRIDKLRDETREDSSVFVTRLRDRLSTRHLDSLKFLKYKILISLSYESARGIDYRLKFYMIILYG